MVEGGKRVGSKRTVVLVESFVILEVREFMLIQAVICEWSEALLNGSLCTEILTSTVFQ